MLNHPNYKADKAKAFETIKSRAFKLSYQYMMTYDSVNNASFFVKPSKSYVVMYVYDISPRAATYFKAYLMTSDKEISKEVYSQTIRCRCESAVRELPGLI
jgi:hypothetical protein